MSGNSMAFKSGAVFQNVLNISRSRPLNQKDKDNITPNTQQCCFCKGRYERLNHVIPAKIPTKVGSTTDICYLAPGCRDCSVKFENVQLNRDITLFKPDYPVKLKATKFFVVQ
eukprot:TRINITY_DN1909_c0_g1_i3.p1 TRINITY_DN1909_c0_g1~~TRINITY_DN1909_c0_g1_i3.p1  ORF type:complete len:113 (+),score=4.43 TRINITY_DN1909_c0_g1_i3:281-619(+)